MSLVKPLRNNLAKTGRQKSSGFTLLEMLLSLLVFAMLGMATYSVLNSTVNGHETIKLRNEQLTNLQRAFVIIESDFTQLAQRQVRLNGEEPEKEFFIAQEYLYESEGIGFAFVRDGWTNPAMVLPRSELQPVAYRVYEGQLQRLYFNFVDANFGAEPRIQPLLDEVESMTLAYFDGKEWQESKEGKGLPSLVKLIVETKVFGKIERVFPLISATQVVAANGSN